MNEISAQPRIVYIDDDRNQLALVERFLSGPFEVITAENGEDGLRIISETPPDMILLDINMPKMDGYEVCTRLQADPKTSFIPVVFLTAMEEEKDRARAFAAGAADYLVKPVKKDALLEKVHAQLATGVAWKDLQADNRQWHKKIESADFTGFKEHVAVQLNLAPDKKERLFETTATDIYTAFAEMGLVESTLSRLMSQYMGLPYTTRISPETIRMGAIPTAFCKTNHVLPVLTESGEKGFILSNPFNLELVDMLKKHFALEKTAAISIAEPSRIDLFFIEAPSQQKPSLAGRTQTPTPATAPKITVRNEADTDHPIVQITDTILNAAVAERASDIHIEPKEAETTVRFRVDGDLRHAFTLKKATGMMIISRLKAQGGIDIAEKRKPQDGGFVANLGDRVFNFRLSTTSTPNGESLVMRLLEPYSTANSLSELGMLDGQVSAMVSAANRSNGMILIVGSTGSGKTTTIYSLLHAIDHKKRSIMSVEDPVEYRIPFLNQQQVNEKAGVTFDSLLKAAVRQDPDVLFMGEVRDGFSAKMAVDFASTGHLTITTLHTSNATTALFRLHRLGIDRGTMADTIIVIVAQKLLKKLCPHCKQTVPISPQERDMLAAFTDDIPSIVARSVGCPECRSTGYLGREGVYEILEFDPQIAEMVRSNAPIAEIRSFAKRRGDLLIDTHAITKVKELVFTPRDIFEKVLAEETPLRERQKPRKPEPATADAGPPASAASVLLVEDDADTRMLITRFLETDGYTVTACTDGIDALLFLGKQSFDLILSDINMPNLDGFKLLEMINQKGVSVPVIFLTSRAGHEDETRGLELGAVDYIKKPVQKDLLRLRVKKTIQGRVSP